MSGGGGGTSMSRGLGKCRREGAALVPRFLSGHRFDVASITKSNNWVNGTSILFIISLLVVVIFRYFVEQIPVPCPCPSRQTTPTWKNPGEQVFRFPWHVRCSAQVSRSPPKKTFIMFKFSMSSFFFIFFYILLCCRS